MLRTDNYGYETSWVMRDGVVRVVRVVHDPRRLVTVIVRPQHDGDFDLAVVGAGRRQVPRRSSWPFVEVVEEMDVATPEEVGALELFFPAGGVGSSSWWCREWVDACVFVGECNS